MSDYIDKILARSFGQSKAIKPRLASHFEPSLWDRSTISKPYLSLDEREFEPTRETGINDPSHAEDQKAAAFQTQRSFAGSDQLSTALKEETNEFEVGLGESRNQPKFNPSILPLDNHPQIPEIRRATSAETYIPREDALKCQRGADSLQKVTKSTESHSAMDEEVSSRDSMLNSMNAESDNSRRIQEYKDKPIAEIANEYVAKDQEIPRNGLLRTSVGDVPSRDSMLTSMKAESDKSRRIQEDKDKSIAEIANEYVVKDQEILRNGLLRTSVGVERTLNTSRKRENGLALKNRNKERIAIRDKDSLENSIFALTGNQDSSSLIGADGEGKMAIQHIHVEQTRKTKSQSFIPSPPSPPSQAEIKSLNSSSQNKVVAQPYVRTFAKQDVSEPDDSRAVPEPTIEVTIGRIEVRGNPQPLKAKDHRWTPPVMSLENYLRQRNNGARS
jgi:hypothetical protein